jgi:hypothetical protein
MEPRAKNFLRARRLQNADTEQALSLFLYGRIVNSQSVRIGGYDMITYQNPLKLVRKSNSTRLFLLIVIIVGALVSYCWAADPSIRIQPDRLSIGQVRVGARVEASILVGQRDADNAVSDVDVKLPSFLTLTEMFRDFHRNWIVFVTFKTMRPGKYEDHIKVYLGTGTAEIPVTAEVLSQETGLTSVLMVETPFHAHSTKNGTIFQAWVEVVRCAKLDINYLVCSRGDGLEPVDEVLKDVELSGFDVVLLADGGLYRIQQADLNKLTTFIEEGGRVIVAADSFLVPSVLKANKLLECYGLKMVNEEPRGRREWELNSTHLATHSFTKSITNLRFFRPSPISVIDEHQAKIIVSAPPYPGQGFVAMAKVGKGEVVAIGQSLWWAWIGAAEAKDFDNSLLLQQLITEPCK